MVEGASHDPLTIDVKNTFTDFPSLDDALAIGHRQAAERGERSEGDVTATLSVKNTFIDLPELDDFEDTSLEVRRRQVSEPVPSFQGRLLGISPKEFSGGFSGNDSEIATLEDTAAGSDFDQDFDPISFGRQESAFSSVPEFARLETEQAWPSWHAGGSLFDEASNPLRPLFIDSTLDQGMLDSYLLDYAATVGCSTPAASPGAPPPDWGETTTLMVRNLPNRYTQQMLLQELTECGFCGTFDFLYLPIDPETHVNKGYGFINFIEPSMAWFFKLSYEGRSMKCFNSAKVVTVAAAALQGFEANHAHYSTSRVSRSDPGARPLFLRESRLQPKNKEGNRRRDGRRQNHSLIDLAAKAQQRGRQHHQHTRPGLLQWDEQPLHLGNPMMGGFGSLPPHLGPADELPQDIPPGLGDSGGTAERLLGTTSSRAEAPQADRSGPQFCPSCGSKVRPQHKFCKFCGMNLQLVYMGAATQTCLSHAANHTAKAPGASGDSAAQQATPLSVTAPGVVLAAAATARWEAGAGL